jgi:hypothetical protein
MNELDTIARAIQNIQGAFLSLKGKDMQVDAAVENAIESINAFEKTEIHEIRKAIEEKKAL